MRIRAVITALQRHLARSRPAREPDASSWSPWDDDEDFVRACFWIVLGRGPSDHELGEYARMLKHGQTREAVARPFLSSTELALRLGAWRAGEPDPRDPAALEGALARFGEPDAFVRLVYDLVLGRPADEDGLRHYAEEIEQGGSRRDLVARLLGSSEFARRFADLRPDAGVVPRDVQLCELANPAKWDNPEWMALLRSLEVVADDKLSMHRKAYEYTQTLYGLQRQGYLREDVRVLSVGAGHECILYWLANRVNLVVATDMYEGRWQADRAMEGDADVLQRPEDFAPFPYRRDHLVFLRMDGSRIACADGAFDVAYSLSSIEHFGGFDAARRSVEEMARALRPGGLLVLATEWRLDGPPAPEVFSPEEIRALVAVPGLRLLEPIDDRVWSRYEGRPVDLHLNPYQTPQMLLKDGDTIFTSILVFLEKRTD